MKYKTIAKSVIGRKHIEKDLPCQDYSLSGNNNGVDFIMVSDGCGSKAHSEVGAQYLCEILFEKVSNEFDEIYQMDDEAAKEYINTFVKEKMISLAEEKGYTSVSDVLATYLFSATKEDKHICVRCGDGGIVLFFQDGSFGLMSEEKSGYVNDAYYFNNPDCVAKMDIEKSDTVLLGSYIYCDGVNENNYNEEEIITLVRTMYSYSNKTMEDIQKDIDESLAIAIKNNSDDCSMAFLVAEKEDFVVKKVEPIIEEQPQPEEPKQEQPEEVVEEKLSQEVKKDAVEEVKPEEAVEEPIMEEKEEPKDKDNKPNVLSFSSKNLPPFLSKNKKGRKTFRDSLIQHHVIDYDYIYIDTCSLLTPDSYGFLTALNNLYEANKGTTKCQIIIHESVMTELNKIKKRYTNLERKAEKIVQLIEDKIFPCLQVGGQKDINFGDLSLYRAIAAIRTIGSVLLITEDKSLKHDCLLLNGLRSQKGKKVMVLSLGEMK